MTRLAGRVALVLMLVLVAGGCRIVLWSWPSGEPVPNVGGAWQGTWMVSPPLPMRVVITAQDGTRVSGVVTYGAASGAISTGISGQFGVRNDLRVLLLTAATLDRTDAFEFTTIEADRLQGAGAGSGFGGQQGALTLRRQSSPPAAVTCYLTAVLRGAPFSPIRTTKTLAGSVVLPFFTLCVVLAQTSDEKSHAADPKLVRSG
jgi:hypothetical protein